MEQEKFMLQKSGEISDLYYFQIVHLGPCSDLIEIISIILWYGIEGIEIYFDDFQYCGDVMMANIVLYYFSIDCKMNLINQGVEVCYRWRHMYYLQSFYPDQLKQVKVKLESGSISTSHL